jgi:hypothetical protein
MIMLQNFVFFKDLESNVDIVKFLKEIAKS